MPSARGAAHLVAALPGAHAAQLHVEQEVGAVAPALLRRLLPHRHERPRADCATRDIRVRDRCCGGRAGCAGHKRSPATHLAQLRSALLAVQTVQPARLSSCKLPDRLHLR